MAAIISCRPEQDIDSMLYLINVKKGVPRTYRHSLDDRTSKEN